jgi:peptide/nickel transport system substrate-binding protein
VVDEPRASAAARDLFDAEPAAVAQLLEDLPRARLRQADCLRCLDRGHRLAGDRSSLRKIVGASTCTPGRKCDLSRGMVAAGNALTVRLSRPDPRLLLNLTFVIPVPGGTPARDVGTRPIPSTGPYAIETYVPGKQLTFARNRYFRSWSSLARPSGYPDEIVWRIGVPSNDAVRQIVSGKADLLFGGVPPDRVEELATRYPRRVHLIPQRATAFVFLDTRRPPFDDLRVRQALNYAVDREQMAELHGGPAIAQPTCQLVPPTVPGHRPYCPYTINRDATGEWKGPDLQKARELVAASGTKGQTVAVWTFPFFAKEGRYLAGLLRRLGYRAQLREFRDIVPYFAAINKGTASVDAGFAGWFGTQLAADMFTTLKCRFAQNWARFCDPVLDRRIAHLAARQAADPGEGVALAARLDRELVDRAPWVPLFTPRFADFASERVGNYQANTYISASVLLDQLWVR